MLGVKKMLKRMSVALACVMLSVAGLLLVGTGGKVSADSGAATYTYLLGAGPICSLEPTACPDIAEAPNGDRIELAGSGTFSIHPKSVTGGGTFTHKNANGDVLA